MQCHHPTTSYCRLLHGLCQWSHPVVDHVTHERLKKVSPLQFGEINQFQKTPHLSCVFIKQIYFLNFKLHNYLVNGNAASYSSWCELFYFTYLFFSSFIF